MAVALTVPDIDSTVCKIMRLGATSVSALLRQWFFMKPLALLCYFRRLVNESRSMRHLLAMAVRAGYCRLRRNGPFWWLLSWPRAL